MNDYKEKMRNKKERYLELADKAEQESNNYYNRSQSYVEHIPMGQPILVGHHSERAHRNALDKSWNAMGKSVAASKKAEYYRNKAASVGKGGISSDDPDAIAKLNNKLNNLIRHRDTMKAANKIVRKKNMPLEAKYSELESLGITKPEDLFEPDFCGRIGFPGYHLTNIGARIKQTQKRIADLQSHKQYEDLDDEQYESFKVLYDENRIQFKFDKKPPKEIRLILGKHAFKWSRTRMTWVRKITANALYDKNLVIKAILNATQ